MSSAVTVSNEGPVARVTLLNTGKFNAMSRAMWRSLRETFEGLGRSTSVRCIVVQGDGGHFCAGGDISEYPDFRFDAAQLQAFHEAEVWGALQAMLDCDIPVLARIEGNCMGAGLEIASCCDLRIACHHARFGAPIARLGFPMAPKEAALVGAAVGDTTARAMLLAAEIFDAPHMAMQGFLTRCVPATELDSQVLALTQRVTALSPQAARLNKRTLKASKMPLAHTDIAQEAIKTIANAANPASAYAYADSPEHREGINAFIQKRTAIF